MQGEGCDRPGRRSKSGTDTLLRNIPVVTSNVNGLELSLAMVVAKSFTCVRNYNDLLPGFSSVVACPLLMKSSDGCGEGDGTTRCLLGADDTSTGGCVDTVACAVTGSGGRSLAGRGDDDDGKSGIASRSKSNGSRGRRPEDRLDEGLRPGELAIAGALVTSLACPRSRLVEATVRRPEIRPDGGANSAGSVPLIVLCNGGPASTSSCILVEVAMAGSRDDIAGGVV